MSDNNYLVAVALYQQNEKRYMPLNGKSIGKRSFSDEGFENLCKEISLELLMRIWQKSDQNSVKRYCKNISIVIVELPLERIQNNMKPLKSQWLLNGDTKSFLDQLSNISIRSLHLSWAKYDGISLSKF